MLNAGTANIGGRIRALRSRQGRSLQEIAGACGITRSMLCKVERGNANPTAALLARVARALGIPMSSLLEEGRQSANILQQREEVQPVTPTDKGYRFFAFAAHRTRKVMQPFLFHARKGQVKRKPLSHPGEEFIYMIRGEMKYRVGRAEYRLRPGDSLYFDAEQEHDLEPMTASVEFLAIFSDQIGAPGAARRRTS
jgi:transcriptional regulator with XRE-family HTH domain